MGQWLMDAIGGFFGGIVDGVKSFLGIHSPSRVFAGIGQYMAEGLGEGFTSEMKSVAKEIDGAIPTSFNIKRDVSVYGSNTPYSSEGTQAKMAQINFIIDGKTVAAAVTPFVSRDIYAQAARSARALGGKA